MTIIKKTISLVFTFILILSLPEITTLAVESDNGFSDYEMGYIQDNYAYSHSLNDCSNHLRTEDLPESFDITTTYGDYFPSITNQIAESCTSYASTYYQFTYEANKYDGVATTHNNTFCPQFTFSHAMTLGGSGSTLQANYDVINRIGCLRYADYDETLIDTDSEFINYMSNNVSAKYEALKTRAVTEKIEYDVTEYVNGEYKPKDVFITFGTNNITDETLDPIKEQIACGKIVTLSVHFTNAVFDNNNSGNYTLLFSAGGIPHALAIVGYCDNYWYDLNGNGTKEIYEKGAFKVANSWGSNYGNGGYFWILYDAFNKTSQCNAPATPQTGRTHLIAYDGRYYPSTGARDYYA